MRTASFFFAITLAVLLSVPARPQQLRSAESEAPQSSAAPTTTASPASDALTFAQITDIHLFDEGKRRDSRSEYEQDQQDNRHALHWAVERIRELTDRGQPIDFVVFTGDFGLEFVRRSIKESLCLDKDDPEIKKFDEYRKKGWPDFVSLKDAANEVAGEFSHLPVRTIYVLPGNNDLVGEDPCDMSRYTEFVQALAAAMPTGRARIVDLLDQSSAPRANGFRLVGLNTAPFKGVDDKEKSTTYGQAKQRRKWDASSAQMKAALDSLTKANRGDSFLIFTHIPDLIDPFNRENSWDVEAATRATWRAVAGSANVTAIFAGHFHSSDRLVYARPGLASKDTH